MCREARCLRQLCELQKQQQTQKRMTKQNRQQTCQGRCGTDTLCARMRSAVLASVVGGARCVLR